MHPMLRPKLEQQREAVLAQLHALPNLMRGSVYERPRKCGRPTCACATGGPKHLTRQLTVTLGGKTHTRYVRQGEMATVQTLIGGYHELWRLGGGGGGGDVAVRRGGPP